MNEYKSGIVSIIGNTNSGKSTLLNAIIGELISVTSPRKQTTRTNVVGIYHQENVEIVFVDTPGIVAPDSVLHQNMRQLSSEATQVDLVLLVVDLISKEGIDIKLLSQLKKSKTPIFLILSKADLVKQETIFNRIIELKDVLPFKEVFPISSIKMVNIKELITAIIPYLSQNEKIYNDNEKTELTTHEYIKQRLLQSLLFLYQQEIPHQSDIRINSVKETEGSLRVKAQIVVSVEKHIKIIVGKGGNKVNEFIKKAKTRLSSDYHKKVFLEVNVICIKDWFNNPRYLQDNDK